MTPSEESGSLLSFFCWCRLSLLLTQCTTAGTPTSRAAPLHNLQTDNLSFHSLGPFPHLRMLLRLTASRYQCWEDSCSEVLESKIRAWLLPLWISSSHLRPSTSSIA